MSERRTLFADILLPVPVPGSFTYRVPFELNDQIRAGMRALVPFGQRKIITGLVRRIHESIPARTPKYIHSILDSVPMLDEQHLTFWEWISSYYLCYPGEVMQAALPASLKLQSETCIMLSPAFDGDLSYLNEKEILLVQSLLNRKKVTVKEVSDILEQQKVINLIRGLVDKGIVLPEEEVKGSPGLKKDVFVKLGNSYRSEHELKLLFEELERKAQRQLELLIRYFSEAGKKAPGDFPEIKRSILLKDLKSGSSALKALVDKGVFELIKRDAKQFETAENIMPVSGIALSDSQEKAYKEIKESFQEKQVTLLHGVTSSGKTEIYFKLIQECLDRGEQVLFLLPEIALTTQIINRVRKYFGDKAGVYHSRFNPQERAKIWEQVRKSLDEGGLGIVLGARSSLFLPFKKLGLIIVDEEHDASYKQYEPSPRYNARDAAVKAAYHFSVKVILGSATPSVESYHNAKTGKYGLCQLKERYGSVPLPEILVADLSEDHKRRRMKSHFSPLLLEYVGEALKEEKQVILFQNRRGFSTRLECETCGYTPTCKHCDVTLIYHKHSNLIKCHYCGFSQRPPDRCPDCNSSSLKLKGFGTEKIEEELAIFFPDARISRMDWDTTRTKFGHQRIISEFEEGKIDILVGTQMVSKGLDFARVGVVGVLNADNMLNFPDFRAYERSFQQLMQVSGRAGRKEERGRVIIQTFNPYHNVILNVIDNKYEEMFSAQLLERKSFHYPPFVRLIRISLKNKDYRILNDRADLFAASLRTQFGKRVLGPEYPLVARVRDWYIKDILIKFERSMMIDSWKDSLMIMVEGFRKEKENRQFRLVIDVDPL